MLTKMLTCSYHVTVHLVRTEDLLDIATQQARQDLLSGWDVLLRHAGHSITHKWFRCSSRAGECILAHASSA